MIIRRLALGVLPLVTSSALAALQFPWLTVGPVTYSNVVVLGANTTDLYFNHDQGIGNVKLKYLSPDLQKRFHYDAKAAAEAERKQAEADALYHSTVASNIAAQVERVRAANAAANAPRECLLDPISEKSPLGKPAPALNVDSWIGDKPDLEGKFVLVSFWEPWSSASLQTLPDLSQLQKKLAGQLVVVGVSTNSEAELSKLSSVKPDFAAATDGKGKISAAAGITSIPCALLIDPKGLVRYQGHPAALTEKKLKAIIAQTAQ